MKNVERRLKRVNWEYTDVASRYRSRFTMRAAFSSHHRNGWCALTHIDMSSSKNSNNDSDYQWIPPRLQPHEDATTSRARTRLSRPRTRPIGFRLAGCQRILPMSKVAFRDLETSRLALNLSNHLPSSGLRRFREYHHLRWLPCRTNL